MINRLVYRLASFSKSQPGYSPQTEQVLLVNEQNQRIGGTTRLRMRTERLCHRSTFIYILHPTGKLFVQKRTSSKDIFPNFYDIATGGVILEDDVSDLESAKRELAEEMGIIGAELEFCFDYFYALGPVWCSVFLTRWDKELVLQIEEVQWVELMSVEEVFERAKSEDFTPDSLEILRVLKEQGRLGVS